MEHPAPRVIDGPALVFPGGGDMAPRMRAHDWAGTILGPLEQWPQSLRTAVSVMLASPHPALIYWGPDLVVLYNDAARFMLGQKHPSGLGQPFQVVFEEAWPLLGPMLQEARRTGVAAHQQNLLVPLDRFGFLEDCFFTFAFVPANDESGRPGGICVFVTDTTAQVLGARRLALVRELSLRVAHAQTVQAALRSIASVLESSADDVPFSLLFELADDGPRCLVRSGAVPDTFPWPLAEVAASGAERLVEGSTRALVLPLPADARGTSLVLVLGLNPRIALNDDARSFSQLIARQIAASIASTSALEEKTRRAADLAALDRQKTEFFSNVSHELRTPLTLILGPVEDALAAPSKSLTGAPLVLVRRNARRLQKMVNTLLDFSRLEAGRARASYEPTDLAALTADLASGFRSVAESAGLSLTIDCPPLPEAVHVDPEMWEKIVLNLLSNAVKYTHRGTIHVSLRLDDADAVLVLRDTGVGIPEEDLPHVFERFYRVRTTEGRSHEGTGIGLALVNELVRLHGGTLEATSRLAAGTAMTVRIPRGSAHLPAEHVVAGPASRASSPVGTLFTEEAGRWTPDDAGPAEGRPTSDTLSSARILLADDNADLRSYVSELLGRVYAHVETVADGEAALEAARRRKPDLVVSDVMMPKLDGIALVKELRADERTRDVPIILLSARAGEDPVVAGLRDGATDYLVKPFSARELEARVRTHLEMARVRREMVRHEVLSEQLAAKVKARDEWLTVVSHELRTPLTALALGIGALTRSIGAAPEQSRARAATVQRQLERMTRQVEALVDVADLATGRLELAREPVDVSALVRAVVEDGRERIARQGGTVITEAGAPVIGTYDRSRLRQLLERLLDNGLKFGGSAPITIAVAAEATHATITVVDHGIGVAGEDEERIFGRFERGVSTESHGGLGLGLWAARVIAEAHGGALAVAPTEGGGATFVARLPLRGSEGPEPAGAHGSTLPVVAPSIH